MKNNIEIENATNSELLDSINKQIKKHNIKDIPTLLKTHIKKRESLELLANAFSEENIKDIVDGREQLK